MTTRVQNPKITRVKLDELAISTDLLGEVLQSFLSEETAIRFTAPGKSMLPFVRDGDILTITPLSQAKLNIGNVVAFIHPTNKNLLVHRVIDKQGSQFLIKGDNGLLLTDGWIHESQLIGCVTRVERDKKKIRFGFGLERYLIAFLSKYNLLTRIYYQLGRIRTKTSRKYPTR